MNRDYAGLILRMGLAFAFLYPPINALSDPNAWIGYFPHFLLVSTQAMGIPDLVVLHSFGLVEIAIALWILSGWKIFLPAIVAAFMLLAIVVMDFSEFQVVFRDLSIAAIAVALAIKHFPHKNVVA